MTPEDINILRRVTVHPLELLRCREAMSRRYGNHPVFVVRIAKQLLESRARATWVAERMLREVRAHLPAGTGLLRGYSNSLLGQEEPGVAWDRGRPA